MQIELYSDKENEDYENFILSNAESYIFHTIEWKNILEDTYKFKPYYLLAKDDDKNIKAILPLFYIKNFTSKKLESIPRSPHGGIIGETKYFESLVKKAIELKENLNCRYLVIKQPPCDSKIEDSFQNFGMTKMKLRVNHIIAIKDKEPEILWNNLKDKNRGAIRKAKKNNITIEKIYDKKELKEIHYLELLSNKRAGLFTPDIKYYEKIWDELNPKNYLEILIAKYENEPVSFGIFFKLHKRMVHAHLGYNIKGRDLGANNLILWTALEDCCKQGYEIFDFGASALDDKGNIPEHFKGIYSYKCAFNTYNLPYSWFFYPSYKTGLDEISNPTKISRTEEEIIKKIPNFIIKKYGTFLIKKL